MLKQQKLFGVRITNEKEDSILEYIFHGLKTSRQKLFITTPNPEMLMYARHHPHFKDILNAADVALPDGVGLFIAFGLLGHRLNERIPGVDFMEKLCARCQQELVSVGFLGGGAGVAHATAERLREKYPGLKVSFARQEWDKDLEESVKADVLFVAYGIPKQEEWIYTHLQKIPVKAAMGVGGSFDYFSGRVPRAPYIIRAMGFEWLFRLVIQPWRIKRQFVLLLFSFLVLKELLVKSKYSH